MSAGSMVSALPDGAAYSESIVDRFRNAVKVRLCDRGVHLYQDLGELRAEGFGVSPAGLVKVTTMRQCAVCGEFFADSAFRPARSSWIIGGRA